MPIFNEVSTEHQRNRWMRPDAHQFIRLDWRRYVRPGFEQEFSFEPYERKYSPSQPRAPAGSSDGGQWTGGDTPDTQAILARARQIAASGSASYQKCLDLCYPILERFKLPGCDFNTFDFHKCMNACLERGR